MDPKHEINVDIGELEGFEFDIADSGNQADKFTKSMEALGQWAGRTMGHRIKTLILQQKEAGPTEPPYPDKGDEKEKAIWNKKYDQYLKEDSKYKDYKSKIFTIMVAMCTKAMKNRVKAEDKFEQAEDDSDVLVLSEMIKSLSYSASDLKYPQMQAVEALMNLILARQQEGEDLVDYYRRFNNLADILELTFGDLNPVKIAEKDTDYALNQPKVLAEERKKLLAFMFMNGADKKVFGYLMKSLKSDYSLNNDQYPETVEDALQVLAMNLPRSKVADGKKTGNMGTETSFNQVAGTNRKCWYCQEEGHVKKQCEKWKKDKDKKSGSTGSFSGQQVVLWSG